MPAIQRQGDSNTGGGTITDIPQSTVYANGITVSVDGSTGTDHGDAPHCEGCWDTSNGSGNVFIEGIPVNRDGDTDTCGHSRESGSDNVFVNG